ncbi:lytic transglycosylase domain-containing protein [Roseateles koreensis]|uniref:Transglycosylase SLT domain-containing protein n=1 Tax=Roseateles koreensis TaxID=2987526 RepID=A0ABT5KNX9_9BURK|nr:lytic transglycosylase domain-containing protein [Roseateles koreensis]MDC8784616.1 transglycosylase SLT domain-containing protein [Roseateles koreensis]
MAVYEAHVGTRQGRSSSQQGQQQQLHWLQHLTLAAMLTLSLGGISTGWAQNSARPADKVVEPAKADALLDEAREALRLKDKKRATAVAAVATEQRHPLAAWMDYWQLNLRLSEISQPELDAFYARWPGSYVEDRMRNNWLLELGHRRDWVNFSADYPRFQMRDDREVACYAALVDILSAKPSKDARDSARSAWLAQRDGDEGCQLLASNLFETRQISSADVWLKLRLAADNNKARLARQTASLLGKPLELSVVEIFDNPMRYLARKAQGSGRTHEELTTLALIRLAANDPAMAAEQLSSRWQRQLPPDLAAWAWAQAGRQAALRVSPNTADSADYFDHALKLAGKDKAGPGWSDDTLAWSARAALRDGRWAQALKSMAWLSDAEQSDTTWQYWRAHALMATAAEGAPGEALRQEARTLLQGIASPLNFYGRLAAEEVGGSGNNGGNPLTALPPAPPPLSAAERATVQSHPGINRALVLINSDLRNEGVREWNFSLRKLNDRELRAAAQEACDREVWDRCINSSERTRREIDLNQRFPVPFRQELQAKARAVGLDPAYVYGLIRQESRFVTDARSHVGAAGLMQVMPATARWTAKKVGIDFRPELLADRDFNVRIGVSYLKLVLDDFGGSMAMAAAAYNAGPGRPRRWREGPAMDAALWVENIPFNETRDYVKKVLTNTTVYAQLLNEEASASSLRARLGLQIGPKAGASNSTLPVDP